MHRSPLFVSAALACLLIGASTGSSDQDSHGPTSGPARVAAEDPTPTPTRTPPPQREREPLQPIDTVPIDFPGFEPSATPTSTPLPQLQRPDLGRALPGVVLDPSLQLQLDLALEIAHAESFTAGTQEQFTLTVKNVGGRDTSGSIFVTDTLPGELSFVSGEGGDWFCDADGQAVSCVRVPPLEAGASAGMVLTVAVAPGTQGMVTNTATVDAPGDSNDANDTAADRVFVSAPRLVPSSLSAAATDEGIQLEWTAVEGADGYELRRSLVASPFIPGQPGAAVDPSVAGVLTRDLDEDTLSLLDRFDACGSSTFSYQVRAKYQGTLGEYSEPAAAANLVAARCVGAPAPTIRGTSIIGPSGDREALRFFQITMCNVESTATYTVLRDGAAIWGPYLAETHETFAADGCAGAAGRTGYLYLQDNMPPCGHVEATYRARVVSHTGVSIESEGTTLTADDPPCFEPPPFPEPSGPIVE